MEGTQNIPSATPPSVTSPPKPFPLLLVILGVAASLLAATAAYLGYQNIQLRKETAMLRAAVSTPQNQIPNLTDNWQAFSDTENGISFKYPPSWDAKKMKGWNFNVFLNDHLFEIPTLPAHFMTPIQVRLNEIQDTTTNQISYSEKTIEEASAKLKTYIYAQNVVEKDNIMIDGHKVIQLSGEAGPGMLEGQFFKNTLIQLDGKVLVVTLNQNKNFEELYDQILSTFTFLEQNESTSRPSTTPTQQAHSGWKIYKNTTLGYSIQFPSSLKTQLINNAAPGQDAPATANGIEIVGLAAASSPYPYGVITIQGLAAPPTSSNTATTTSVMVNGSPATKYEKPNEGNVSYVIQNSQGTYIEIVFFSGSDDPKINTFNQILSTFTFL